jgi:hypothetical protein
LKEVQPWIINNSSFTSIAKSKVAHYEYDEETLCIKNFDQLYLRLKELTEHYTIRPEKIEKIFTQPINPREGKHTRIRRCDPETLKMRRQISKYFSKRKREK